MRNARGRLFKRVRLGQLLFLLSCVICASHGVLANKPPGSKAAPAPVVRVLSPADGSVVRTAQVRVRVGVRVSAGTPITRIYAMIGKDVIAQSLRTANRGIVLFDGAGVGKALAADEQAFELLVPIPPEDVSLVLRADTADSTSEPAVVQLRWEGSKQDAFVAKPKLYVLSVGISKYQRKELSLHYPAKDAVDLVDSFTRQSGQLYREVQTRVFVDAEATKGNILDGLEWLQRQTTARDIAVLFLAGHGINEPGSNRYFFVPHDADLRAIQRTMVSQEDIQGALKSMAGKVLVFLDTCHSGNVLGTWSTRDSGNNSFIAELASSDNGIVVFAASTGRQASKESPEWGNGAFTRALLEAMHGEASFVKGRPITVNMLELYLSERVKELTNGTQSPSTAKPSSLPDFPVAIAGDNRDKDANARLFNRIGQDREKPIHKKWWFWTLIGGTAAAMAVGLGVGLSQMPREPEPPPGATILMPTF